MPGADRSSFEFGRFRLDTVEHELSRDGRRVPLTPKAYDILRLLVENAGHLVEKERLLQEVWPNTFVEEGALNRCISVLRKTLSESEADKYVETVPKRGYRFVAAVKPVSVGDASAQPIRVHAGWPSPALLAALALVALLTVSVVLQFSGAPTPVAAAVHQQVTTSGHDGAPTLSGDGRHVAYVSAAGPDKRLIVQQVENGQPVSIVAAPELGYLRWSPDGSQLLYWARGAGHDGVYAIPQLGGIPRLISRRQFVACWSPDGQTIAVTSYTGKISLHDLAGNELRTLTVHEEPWSIWDLDWSPANGLLLFVASDTHGAYTVWTITADGREQRKLFDASAEISAARWSEDGNAIYFLQRSNQTASLEKWWPATGERKSLLSGLEAGHAFAISRDGTRLAYARAPFYSNLRRLDVSSGETTELTAGTSLIERPRMSPDGTRVLFNVGHPPHANLYTMPITGGPMTQLTFFDSFNVG